MNARAGPVKTRAVGAPFFARAMGVAALLAATVSTFARSAAASAGPDTAGGEASLKLPNLSSVNFLGIDGHRLLTYGILFCIFGLIFGLTIYRRLKNLPVHRAMLEVSELIYETCKTYLITQGKFLYESWNRLPMIRMTNVSLLPGTWEYDDLIAATDDAILMDTNRSWSIDDRRYHFQFSTEIGWEIKNGKKARMLKNPSYSGITTEFWGSCDAICSRDYWTLWGTPNCGKGQPMQTMGTGHGAAPARFRNVKIGVAFAK